MPTLSNPSIATLLAPYYPSPTDLLLTQLSQYLDLLLKWNARTNLTSIRDPQEIIRTHFGESLLAASHLPPAETLLDLGSGAGFPGLPIQLALPNLRVTLAESQNKKATFLREVVRNLGVSTEVWAARAETMPTTRLFDVVTLRAVDNPAAALAEAKRRLVPGGCVAHLSTAHADSEMVIVDTIPVPGKTNSQLFLLHFSTDKLF